MLLPILFQKLSGHRSHLHVLISCAIQITLFFSFFIVGCNCCFFIFLLLLLHLLPLLLFSMTVLCTMELIQFFFFLQPKYNNYDFEQIRIISQNGITILKYNFNSSPKRTQKRNKFCIKMVLRQRYHERNHSKSPIGGRMKEI